MDPLKTKWLPQPLKNNNWGGGYNFFIYTLLTFVSGLNNNAVVKNKVSGNSPSIKLMGGGEFQNFLDADRAGR